ncbi:unnamed protein product [Linum trigynum]|uniref:Uncharacterized protein n=1 Tax=Linum trigynum TaxID=586398 RepID=A0AAV2GTZ7_9ROSI
MCVDSSSSNNGKEVASGITSQLHPSMSFLSPNCRPWRFRSPCYLRCSLISLALSACLVGVVRLRSRRVSWATRRAQFPHRGRRYLSRLLVEDRSINQPRRKITGLSVNHRLFNPAGGATIQG